VGVDGQTGDPLGPGHQLLGQLELGEVVDPHVALGGDEQVGLDRVEEDALDQALGLAERDLGAPLREL